MSDSGDEGAGLDPYPTFRELLDWVEGRLDGERAQAIDARVASGDESIAATVAWIRGFLAFGRSHPIPEPPPILRQRLRQSFRRHIGAAEPASMQRAELVFDSRSDAVLAGVRGGSDPEDGYRLAFAAEPIGVLIDVVPESAGTVSLAGQVLAEETDAPVWAATIDHATGTLTAIDGDSDGCFAIAGVPVDTTKLTLSNGVVEIVIEGPLGGVKV